MSSAAGTKLGPYPITGQTGAGDQAFEYDISEVPIVKAQCLGWTGNDRGAS